MPPGILSLTCKSMSHESGYITITDILLLIMNKYVVRYKSITYIQQTNEQTLPKKIFGSVAERLFLALLRKNEIKLFEIVTI